MTQTNAGHFKIGNEIWKLAQKAGRPETWTEDEVCSLAGKLLEWVDKEDSVCMRGFTSENRITYETISWLSGRFAEFAEIYRIARETIANRMAQKLGKQVHPAHYNRYQSVYDPELKAHEKEMANSKADQEDERQKELEARASVNSMRVAEQIKAHLDKGKI